MMLKHSESLVVMSKHRPFLKVGLWGSLLSRDLGRYLFWCRKVLLLSVSFISVTAQKKPKSFYLFVSPDLFQFDSQPPLT